MIKRIKHFKTDALIFSEFFRKYAEKFESKLLRGISNLSILTIIKKHRDEGTYGFEIIRELTKETNSMLILEEGTLYPLLRKLEEDKVVRSEKKRVNGRVRNYYFMTDDGIDILNHHSGFFTKLIEAMGSILDLDIELKSEKFIYCPNCSNKIELSVRDVRFCNVCGFDFQNPSQNKHGGNQQ